VFEIVALLASPMIAVVVGQFMTERRERIRRRHAVFQSLWLTRVDPGSFGRLSGEHVRNLNLIEIEFSRSKMDEFMESGSEHVVLAWRRYLAALNNTPLEVIRDHSSPEAAAWFAMRDGLLVDLLFEMSSTLGYAFSRDDIRSSSYAPQSYLDAEGEGMANRRAIGALLRGERAIHITSDPVQATKRDELATSEAVRALPEGSEPPTK
jgi:hypothetical protein